MASSSTLAAADAKKTKMHNEGSLAAPEAKKTKIDNASYFSRSRRVSFEIKESVALASKTLSEGVELVGANLIVPVPNVSSKILVLVISYLNKHHNEEDKNEEEIKEMLKWDKEFFKAIDNIEMIFDLINASNYMEIESLVDSACEEAADRVKGMSIEDAIELFGEENDFTRHWLSGNDS
ncbi:hypothetical protein MKX01_032211 [Papaver californicum]|nr:hypothetical protein MKX01_032211 [Papaver californicum]